LNVKEIRDTSFANTKPTEPIAFLTRTLKEASAPQETQRSAKKLLLPRAQVKIGCFMNTKNTTLLLSAIPSIACWGFALLTAFFDLYAGHAYPIPWGIGISCV